MAMSTGTAILLSTAVGGGLSYLSSKQASKASTQAASTEAQSYALGVEEQRRQFDISRADLAPWMEAGKWGLEGLKKSIGTYEGYVSDPSSYMKSPYYDFVLGEGLGAISRKGAAKGKPVDKDLMEYGMNLASTDYGNFLSRYGDLINRYAGISGTGQTTATNLGQMGMQTAGNISNLYGKQGQAYAGGLINQANARTGMYRSFTDIGSRGIDQYLMSKYLDKNMSNPSMGYGYTYDLYGNPVT